MTSISIFRLTRRQKERQESLGGNMILSISLSPDGSVKEIHAAKSLSPTLDEAVIDAVRSWRFKKFEGNPENSLEDLRLRFDFRATCWTAPKPFLR